MSKPLFRDSYRKPKTQIVIPDRVALRAATKYKADGECWVSTYSVASHGYAQVGWREKGELRCTTAHRAAWVHHTGAQIPEGCTIDHLCKNRLCVKPDHHHATVQLKSVGKSGTQTKRGWYRKSIERKSD